MCGIAGILEVGGAGDDRGGQLGSMIQALGHRGPDDQGRYGDEAAGVLLGHTRLSIIDTSQAGHQPMVSRSGRYVLVFNGEIYNAPELAKTVQLAEGNWTGHSDTEVLLELIDQHGLANTLPRCNGMFALALWDTIEHRLHLARDRVGIKPLYIGQQGGVLAFASELKAIRCLPEFPLNIDRSALHAYVNHGYVPGPASIVANVRKLPPGHLASISCSGSGGLDVHEEAWWSLEPNIRHDLDYQQAVQQTESLLLDSTRLRLNSDRPLGILLSGGIDSTLVAVMATQAGSNRPRTFSIGFEQEGYDESAYAADIAAHLNTDHVEHIMTSQDVLDLVPRMSLMFDEPFSESSQLPTALVFAKAASDAVVCLSGDGGDELHAGYVRYEWAMRFWNRMRFCPRPLRKVLGSTAACCPGFATGSIGRFLNAIVPKRMRVRNPEDKWNRAASLVQSKDFDALYHQMVSLWHGMDLVIDGQGASHCRHREVGDELGTWHRMMYRDFHDYLPDDILVKVDRTSMAVGVEARVPMLDHRLVELAWSLPIEIKRKGQSGKSILKSVLENCLPRHLWDRPKQGFSVPLGSWLKGPLRSWAEDMLDENRMKQQGYFRSDPIRHEWKTHLSGAADRSARLWPILMFQAWLEANG
ncbi:MAG: asparagine synthase (glutamine-hydrolyzing) [Phycisphaerales bacterium]|nr:asparagine synthase (glutamine-hydrolyzing) [Phycisphaerales bacterium]